MVVTLDDPFWQGPVTIRLFGWFLTEDPQSSDRGILPPLEAFAARLPSTHIELVDTDAEPSLTHTHLVSSRRTVRVFGADNKQVECPDLRKLWPSSENVFVEGRPTKWFGEKHGLRKKHLTRPIEQYEFTELAALKRAKWETQALAAPDLWLLPDLEGPEGEYGPVFRKALIHLCDWGLMEMTDRVRCLGQATFQLVRDQKGTPAPDGTILPTKEQEQAAVVAYCRARARAWVRLHHGGTTDPPTPVPVPMAVDAPPHFRFAGCDWAEGMHPSLRLFYVSGADFTSEVRLFPFSPVLSSDDPWEEPACLTAFRAERRSLIENGLLGRKKTHSTDLLETLARVRLCDGKVLRLLRWRTRAFEETVMADDITDVFLPVRSGRLWALLRISVRSHLWNDLEAGRTDRAVEDPPSGLVPVIHAWRTQWTEWLDLFAKGSVESVRMHFPHPASRKLSWVPGTAQGEHVLAPFEPCGGEVVWFAPTPEAFAEEARRVRESGARVRFIIDPEAFLAAIQDPALITIVVPGDETAAGAIGLFETVHADIAARRANHRVIRWFPDDAVLGRRRRGVSNCTRSDLLLTLGTELFRERYPVVDIPPGLKIDTAGY